MNITELKEMRDKVPHWFNKEIKLFEMYSKVKEKFSINVSDDVAEAILIGMYGTRVHAPKITTAFGRRVD